MVYSITVVVITLKFTCVVFGTVLAPLTTLSLLHRRKKAPEENLGSLLNTSFVNNHSKLLNDGSYTTGTNGSTTLTDSEGKTLLHSDGMDQFDGHLYVITRHAHLNTSGQFANAGNVGGSEVELRTIVVEERSMTSTFILGQNVYLSGKLSVARNATSYCNCSPTKI